MEKILFWLLLSLVIASSHFEANWEFAGPVHQFIVDHMRHHQIEVMKEEQKSKNSF